MNSQDFSSLFLFTRMSNHENAYALDKETKEKVNSIYEKRINEFLTTWFIFSCNNGSCCHKSSNENTQIKNSLNVVERVFYLLFGDDYVKNTMQYIIPKLNRFRHIIKEEDGEFDSSYEDFVSNNKIFKAVLSREDHPRVLKSYRDIFKYYKDIIYFTNEQLMLMFDDIASEISYSYIGDIDSIENRTLPVIQDNIFYNNDQYDGIRKKLLVIFYEIICRFYCAYDIDVYSIDKPDNILNFYEIKKSVISNNVLYIFLKDCRNVLVYDFEDKLVHNPEFSATGYQCKISTINAAHKMFLLTFTSDIVNMVYSDSNIVITLETGDILINGSNENNKISKTNDKYFGLFVQFKTLDIKSILSIKIFNKHIYVTDTNGVIYIYGKLGTGSPFYKNSTKLDENVRSNNDYKKYQNFVLSENEQNIKFLKHEDIGYHYVFDAFEMSVSVDNKTLIVNNYIDGDSPTEFDFGEKHEVISDIFSLRDNGAIIETRQDDNNDIVSYYTIGLDATSSCRLGRKPLTSPSYSIYLSEISDYIQRNSEDEVDKTITVQKVDGTKTHTLILNSLGDIYGAGTNEGYFMSLNNLDNGTDEIVNELEHFTKINSNSTNEIFTDFVMTKGSDKTLVLEYNKYIAIGYGSLYFVGMRNSAPFRNNDEEVKAKFASKNLSGKTNPKFYSYFCTPNCICFINPIYDLISYYYRSNPVFEDRTVSHIKKALLYLANSSIGDIEEAYEHMVNNLTNIYSNNDILNMNQSLVLFSNLQNYTMHDSMLLLYINDRDKYSAVSKFINLIGLVSENFSAMMTKRCRIGNMSFDEFLGTINDLNVPSICEIKEKINGIRNDKRAK